MLHKQSACLLLLQPPANEREERSTYVLPCVTQSVNAKDFATGSFLRLEAWDALRCSPELAATV